MIKAYRLSHTIALHTNPDPFKPAGSENRWNSEGVQVAYAGESLALIALELLTYWGAYPSLSGYQLFTLDFAETGVEDALEHQPDIDPRDKRQTRRYGDRWVDEQRSLVLRIPSVVLDMSSNYLINPAHPHYDPKAVVAHGAFEYDERIGRLLERAKG